MERRQGFTLLELIVVIGLLVIILTGVIEVAVTVVSTSAKEGLSLQRMQALEQTTDNIRQDIHASEAVYIRESPGYGFLLKIPHKGSGQFYHVAYNISANEPDSLYRTEFMPDKPCTSIRMLRHIQEFSVVETSPRLFTVTLGVTPTQANTKLRYTVKSALRTGSPKP